jgi:hypothetical protein
LPSCEAARMRLYRRRAGRRAGWRANLLRTLTLCRRGVAHAGSRHLVQRPAGVAVDRVDRRGGTAAQSIAPATLATAGIARRLGSSSVGSCDRGHLDFAHSRFCGSTLDCCQCSLCACCDYLHTCTYRGHLGPQPFEMQCRKNSILITSCSPLGRPACTC